MIKLLKRIVDFIMGYDYIDLPLLETATSQRLSWREMVRENRQHLMEA